jgi:methionyl-tRNA formyltransferase
VTLKLAFMGTPDFAVPVLADLLAVGHQVCRVYTQPPRPAGRGQREQPSPVARFAAERGIPVATPKSLRKAEAQAEFAALGLDVAVVAAYGLILPRAILAAPRLGCINVHASLLPRWRGAAPIQRAILAGDRESGVTIMQMDEGLDTGAMLKAEPVPIGAEMSAGALHDVLAALGARLLVATLAEIEAGRPAPVPQPTEGVTYAAKIDKDEARIDWSKPAEELARQVRAFAPVPGAWFEHDAGTGKPAERIRVLAARVETGQGEPGRMLDDRLLVACGAGALRLLSVQRAGRAAMAAADFLRGNAIQAGTVLRRAAATP